MASSEVDICNLALGFLGANPIVSLADSDPCKDNYPVCRDACLEDVDWTFAAVRFKLEAPSADTPSFGYANQFLLPTGILRVIEVNGNQRQWVKEGNFILADDSVLKVRAVKRVTDVRQFPNAFIQMVAARLAAVIAIPIANSDGMAKAMLNMYQSFKSEAAMNDGRQGSNQKVTRRNPRRRHTL